MSILDLPAGWLAAFLPHPWRPTPRSMPINSANPAVMPRMSRTRSPSSVLSLILGIIEVDGDDNPDLSFSATMVRSASKDTWVADSFSAMRVLTVSMDALTSPMSCCVGVFSRIVSTRVKRFERSFPPLPPLESRAFLLGWSRTLLIASPRSDPLPQVSIFIAGIRCHFDYHPGCLVARVVGFAHHEEFGDIRSSHVVCSYQNRVVAYEYVTLPERLGDRTHRAGDEHKKAVHEPVYAWIR